ATGRGDKEREDGHPVHRRGACHVQRPSTTRASLAWLEAARDHQRRALRSRTSAAACRHRAEGIARSQFAEARGCAAGLPWTRVTGIAGFASVAAALVPSVFGVRKATRRIA